MTTVKARVLFTSLTVTYIHPSNPFIVQVCLGQIGAQILVFKQVQVFSESQIVLKGGLTCEFGSCV